MRVLILTCSTGEGHNSVALAVEESLQKRGISCRVQDALQFFPRQISKTISEGHVWMYRHLPKVYGKGYAQAERHPAAFDRGSAVYMLLETGTDKLYDFIQAGGYRCIICPHVIPSLMLTILRRKRKDLSVYACNIATDYTCSPMTGESDLDAYFVPDSKIVGEFIEAGVNPKKIHVTDGIPVRHEFYSRIRKPEAKKLVGIDPQAKHILMMFGSMGAGPMRRLTEALRHRLVSTEVLTVVCGTNKRILSDLRVRNLLHQNVRAVGFVQNTSLLMDSADIFITKPGGISTSEAVVKGLPMVLENRVSACENYNLKLFCEAGCAIAEEDPEELAVRAIRLLRSPAALQNMAGSLVRQRIAADEVAEILLKDIRKTS
jgi:processive 1,2-diacylglycerol beta-glucosyltransferase